MFSPRPRYTKHQRPPLRAVVVVFGWRQEAGADGCCEREAPVTARLRVLSSSMLAPRCRSGVGFVTSDDDGVDVVDVCEVVVACDEWELVGGCGCGDERVCGGEFLVVFASGVGYDEDSQRAS